MIPLAVAIATIGIALLFGVQAGTIVALCALGTAAACWLMRGGKLPPSAFDDHSD